MAVSPPRPSIPDSLELACDALDRLIRDARLPPRGRHDLAHEALEERAQAIAASIVAPFRGNSAPPARLLASGTEGNKAWAAW
ncbi:MAG: hypothetical protein DI606_04340 [Sphingobium sp.]|uniref:hypothetical protein n=1 Tax=Sphingobium sp. TaxID=1912891 RepID=UPI000DB272F3|nr:hypothetical protein [Sphingobium sp.]PZU13801.1 MAG: hypothetical protein DI606_04340 [Sphingobium sp.]